MKRCSPGEAGVRKREKEKDKEERRKRKKGGEKKKGKRRKKGPCCSGNIHQCPKLKKMRDNFEIVLLTCEI